jgi:integral membrane sensor domain MASE1
MRTLPALILCLLTPLLALAQPQGPVPPEQGLTQSPLFWYWMVALVIAVAAFIWASISISRRRGPPSRPRIS